MSISQCSIIRRHHLSVWADPASPVCSVGAPARLVSAEFVRPVVELAALIDQRPNFFLPAAIIHGDGEDNMVATNIAVGDGTEEPGGRAADQWHPHIIPAINACGIVTMGATSHNVHAGKPVQTVAGELYRQVQLVLG